MRSGRGFFLAVQLAGPGYSQGSDPLRGGSFRPEGTPANQSQTLAGPDQKRLGLRRGKV